MNLSEIQRTLESKGIKSHLLSRSTVELVNPVDPIRIEDRIFIASTWNTIPSGEATVYAAKAVGLCAQEEWDDDQKKTWDELLFTPEASDFSSAQNALKDEALVDYRSAVESIDDPVKRLCAIHCYNALAKSGVSITDARNLQLSAWGNTSSFVLGKLPCSLAPLAGVYCPLEISTFFPSALASLVSDDLIGITHPSIRRVMTEIIRSLLDS